MKTTVMYFQSGMLEGPSKVWSNIPGLFRPRRWLGVCQPHHLKEWNNDKTFCPTLQSHLLGVQMRGTSMVPCRRVQMGGFRQNLRPSLTRRWFLVYHHSPRLPNRLNSDKPPQLQSHFVGMRARIASILLFMLVHVPATRAVHLRYLLRPWRISIFENSTNEPKRTEHFA